MAALSKKLRSATGGFVHWCPGCDGAHYIRTDQSQPTHWGWNGDVDRPIAWPSVRCFTTDPQTKAQRTLCHYFLGGAARDKPGMIEFCGDSPHALAGQTVALPDFPEGD
jgi:hypothetical protein